MLKMKNCALAYRVDSLTFEETPCMFCGETVDDAGEAMNVFEQDGRSGIAHYLCYMRPRFSELLK